MCGIVGYIGRGHEAQQVILDALRAGDVPGSVVAMRTHLSRIEDHLPRIRA